MAKGLDFETFSEVNLPEQGLDNYINHPSFRPLLASIAYRGNAGSLRVVRFDFVTADAEAEMKSLHAYLDRWSVFVAHNASFERAVSRRIGADAGPENFRDSAVISRAVGAGQKLEAAAPQLVDADKMEVGMRLIRKFSMPQPNGYVYVDHVEDWTQEDWDDWKEFGDYCDLDAKLSLLIEEQYGAFISGREWEYELVTQAMNDVGWRVDVELLERMDVQYQHNLLEVDRVFRRNYDPGEELNFRSTPQLREWCKERGINAKSFDEQNVGKLLARVRARLEALHVLPSHTVKQAEQYICYSAVRDMLETKVELGGSSLSKLKTIRNLTGADERLRGQYLHIGAGQTWRTSGRGAQMQNLKRLGPEPDDVDGDISSWSNDTLARNLRQVFTAGHPDGQIIVGDFSSVESRGLAYLAGAKWKLDAYWQGKDMYKVLAEQMLGVPYDDVSKEQRQTGKVGELSCGYGAGAGAVRTFAEKMHVMFSEDEAGKVVRDWRDTNPEVVDLWKALDDALHQVVEHGQKTASFFAGPDLNLKVQIRQRHTPESLRRQMAGAQTITLELWDILSGENVLTRWFQGCFMDGRDVCYHKPSELKSGNLWHDHWTKNGQTGRYKIYGGKLAGILTQSFCREIFMSSLHELHTLLEPVPNARIVGQFHDEIAVEWKPSHQSGSVTLLQAARIMEGAMTACSFPGFPLGADIKHAYRYIK